MTNPFREHYTPDEPHPLAELAGAAPDLLTSLEIIERLSREADGSLVDVRAMLGDIARAAITKATKAVNV